MQDRCEKMKRSSSAEMLAQLLEEGITAATRFDTRTIESIAPQIETALSELVLEDQSPAELSELHKKAQRYRDICQQVVHLLGSAMRDAARVVSGEPECYGRSGGCVASPVSLLAKSIG